AGRREGTAAFLVVLAAGAAVWVREGAEGQLRIQELQCAAGTLAEEGVCERRLSRLRLCANPRGQRAKPQAATVSGSTLRRRISCERVPRFAVARPHSIRTAQNPIQCLAQTRV